MLLRRLVEYAESHELPPPYYCLEKIRYVVDFPLAGPAATEPKLIDLASAAPQTGKGGGRGGVMMHLPDTKRSSEFAKPRFLADHSEYVFALPKPGGAPPLRAVARQKSFIELLERYATECEWEEPLLAPVLHFLKNDPLHHTLLPEGFDPNATVTFRVAGQLLGELSSAQVFWANFNDPATAAPPAKAKAKSKAKAVEAAADMDIREAAGAGEITADPLIMQCLVCGKRKPVLKRLKSSLAGIGPATGVALISANAGAFESHGLEATLNSPICGSCGDKIMRAANALLADPNHRLEMADATFLFWSSSPPLPPPPPAARPAPPNNIPLSSVAVPSPANGETPTPHVAQGQGQAQGETSSPTPDVLVMQLLNQPNIEKVNQLLSLRAPAPAFVLEPEPEPEAGAEAEASAGAEAIEAATNSSDGPTGFYMLCLSVAKSRAVVRRWLDTDTSHLSRDLARWFRLQRIVSPFGEGRDAFEAYAPPLSIYELASATVRDAKKELASPVLSALMYAALTQTPLPLSLLGRVVGRCRAGREVTRPQASLIKMILLSQPRSRLLKASAAGPPGAEDQDKDKKEADSNYMVELELTETDPGYLCGRLLALLARIQELAILRPTTSLIDRYYGAACATPAYAFSSLMKLVQTHLSKLERDYPGAYYALQQELEQLLLQLKKFPMLLTQEQQAMFSLGYYHQRAHFRAQSAEWKKKAKGKRSDTSDTSFDEGEGGAAEAEEKESGVEGES